MSREEAVTLRDVVVADLPIFFEHQRDPVALRMAAFTSRDHDAFMAHWTDKILANDEVVKQTVLCGERVAGNLVCYREGRRHLVGYWIGRAYWGRGIATRALAAFVAGVRVRPLHAFVAKTNRGSIRVLEKCGFAVSGEDCTPAMDGGEAVEEFVFTLD